MADWLLISAFGGAEPSIIGVGSSPKAFIPLAQHFRPRRGQSSTALADVQGVLLEVMAAPQKIDRPTSDGRKRLVAVPLFNSEGRLHAVNLWRGDADEKVPSRDPVGAWHFNLTTSTASGSDDLFDLYGVAPEDRRKETATAGAFGRLVTNRDEGEALAKIVQSAPGTEHQAVWKVRRDDGEERAAHFSCRMLEERTDDGHSQVILRGVTHDIGPAENVQSAPPPVILEHRVLDTLLQPGQYLAYVDLKRLALIKWRGAAMPGLAWERAVGEPDPEIHPDDLPRARAMAKQLAHSNAEDVIRFRGLDGGWIPVRVALALVAFDEATHGGLATLSLASDDE